MTDAELEDEEETEGDGDALNIDVVRRLLARLLLNALPLGFASGELKLELTFTDRVAAFLSMFDC